MLWYVSLSMDPKNKKKDKIEDKEEKKKAAREKWCVKLKIF